MSFYISIKTHKQLTYKELMSNLVFPNVELSEPNGLNEPIDSNICKVFMPHESTRGALLYYSNAEYTVGINILSSETDFRLALNIAETISIITHSDIIPEDSETGMDLKMFKTHYDKKWIDREKLLGVPLLLDNIGQKGQTVAIDCCYMTYLIGPKIHASLDKSSIQAYYNSLVEKICKTQFFDQNKYTVPNVMQVKNKGTEDVKRMIVLYPNGGQFLPSSDILVIQYENEFIELPYDKISNIANTHFHRIDEEQYIVDSLTTEEFIKCFQSAKSLLSTANATTTNQGNSDDTPKKKWWQFW